MKFQSLIIILTLTSLVFGCSLTDKLKAASNTNGNFSAVTPAPKPSATSTVSPSATPDGNKTSLGRNLLAFGAGTLVVAKTSQNSDGQLHDTFEGARVINTEAIAGGWLTKKGQIKNQSVVLELPARTTLKTFVIDSFYGTSEKKGVKDFRVEISDSSATDGFQTILEATAQDAKADQIFPVKNQIAGRFLRYSPLNNYGSPDFIWTKEISGYGEQETVPMLQNLSGTYKNKDYSTYGGLIHIKQEGSSVIGCYEGAGLWTLQGTVEGRVMSYRMKGKIGYLYLGTDVFTADGKSFTETTWAGEKKDYDNLNFGEKVSDKIGKCEAIPNLDGSSDDAAKSQIEKNLNDSGRAVLYGINFDFNSDVIKSESKPTLDKTAAIMKEKSGWKFSIEGHTDNVGGDSFNQTLSDKRAASVVKYLTDAGIDKNRLSSKGFGLSKPVAANDSETGRAQNRRVELVKQ